jgi:hypothetical protein
MAARATGSTSEKVPSRNACATSVTDVDLANGGSASRSASGRRGAMSKSQRPSSSTSATALAGATRAAGEYSATVPVPAVSTAIVPPGSYASTSLTIASLCPSRSKSCAPITRHRTRAASLATRVRAPTTTLPLRPTNSTRVEPRSRRSTPPRARLSVTSSTHASPSWAMWHAPISCKRSASESTQPKSFDARRLERTKSLTAAARRAQCDRTKGAAVERENRASTGWLGSSTPVT